MSSASADNHSQSSQSIKAAATSVTGSSTAVKKSESSGQTKLRLSVTAFTEDLVREYLAASQYSETLAAFVATAPTTSQFADLDSTKLGAVPPTSASRIEAMVDYIVKPRRRSAERSAKVGGDDAADWSKDQVARLRAALKEYPSTLEKAERFNLIAAAVGKTRRECYDKAKALRAKALAARAAKEKEGKEGGEEKEKERRRHRHHKEKEKKEDEHGHRHHHRHHHGHHGHHDKKKSAARLGMGGDDALAALLGDDAGARGGGGGKQQEAVDDGWGDMMSHVKTKTAPSASASSHRDAKPSASASRGYGEPAPATTKKGWGSPATSSGAAPARRAAPTQKEQAAPATWVIEEEVGESKRGAAGGAGGYAGANTGSGGVDDAEEEAGGPGWGKVGAGVGWGRAVVDDGSSLLAQLHKKTGGAGLLMQDAGDEDVTGVPVKKKASAPAVPTASPASLGLKGRLIQPNEAVSLRKLLFGDSTKCFNDAWKKQGIFFTDVPKLGYGLVQREGGPCGPIAALNAFIIRRILFSMDSAVSANFNQPSKEVSDEAIVWAMTEMIWRARDGGGAVVALLGSRPCCGRTSQYTPDKITERLMLYSVPNRDKLSELLRTQLPIFQQEDGPGIILFLYSVMMSRGLPALSKDIDSGIEVGKLIGQYNYAAQEMVNLLLSGRAVSNVFNGTKVLESGKDRIVLTGVPHQAPVGFMTLFEHYEYVNVGSHYHCPEFPVWVVCSESHYSVLFARERSTASDMSPAKPFDIFYYDQLAKQDEVYRLTVTPRPDPPLTDKQAKSDDNPPIDLCLRTRWKAAGIDWNGSEALL